MPGTKTPSPDAAEAAPADRVVFITFTTQAELCAVTALGRIFKYERDTQNFGPKPIMVWNEIKGPVL